LNAIGFNPDAEHIWIQTGIFDSAIGLILGRDLDDIYNRTLTNILAVLEPVWEQHSELYTVSMGYEILIFEMERWPGCAGAGSLLFRNQCGPDPTPACIAGVTDDLQKISDALEAANPGRHTSLVHCDFFFCTIRCD